MMLITTLVVSFCKDGVVSFSVNLWFLVVDAQCQVLCHLVFYSSVITMVHRPINIRL